MTLTPDDFPLVAVGNRIYAKHQSSPIALATTDELAYEICKRLNYSDVAGFGDTSHD